MLIENFKIHHLTNDQFKVVQETIFKNNCSWIGSNAKVIKEYPDDDISIAVNDLEARSGSDIVQTIFDQLRGEEITFEQFATKYNILTSLTFTKQQMFDFAEFYANNSDTTLNDELLKQFLNP